MNGAFTSGLGLFTPGGMCPIARPMASIRRGHLTWWGRVFQQTGARTVLDLRGSSTSSPGGRAEESGAGVKGAQQESQLLCPLWTDQEPGGVGSQVGGCRPAASPTARLLLPIPSLSTARAGRQEGGSS
jgi:hypothetical protein